MLRRPADPSTIPIAAVFFARDRPFRSRSAISFWRIRASKKETTAPQHSSSTSMEAISARENRFHPDSARLRVQTRTQSSPPACAGWSSSRLRSGGFVPSFHVQSTQIFPGSLYPSLVSIYISR